MPKTEFKSKIKAYYAQSVEEEWRRLTNGALNRLEFDTTIYLLNKYLPKKGLILDAGSGPGRYTFSLAAKGYDMVMLDFTPANLEFAKRKARRLGLQNKTKGIVEGSLDDLSMFDSNSFDAVICLGGPLSHVMSKIRREKAVYELVRVAKPGAYVFVSVMNMMSNMVGYLRDFQREMSAPYFKNFTKTGDYPGGYGFTAYHGFTPEELHAIFKNTGAEVLGISALEGFASYSAKELDRLHRNKKRWNVWIQVHRSMLMHPSCVGVSQHILAICRKH